MEKNVKRWTSVSLARVEGGQAQSVGMLHHCAGRIHDGALEDQIVRLVEGDATCAPARLICLAALVAAHRRISTAAGVDGGRLIAG